MSIGTGTFAGDGPESAAPWTCGWTPTPAIAMACMPLTAAPMTRLAPRLGRKPRTLTAAQSAAVAAATGDDDGQRDDAGPAFKSAFAVDDRVFRPGAGGGEFPCPFGRLRCPKANSAAHAAASAGK
ncbi:hypothetical protein [Streptomyces sp. NPDC101237]|uniref:hypothetical protein n=1 Tax=Streptomyces sp. NPDC101237 TaxID=3366139 RepID=UPI0037F5695A